MLPLEPAQFDLKVKSYSDVWWRARAGTRFDFLVIGIKLLQSNASVSSIGTCWSQRKGSFSLKDLETQIKFPLPLWFPLIWCHWNHLSSVEWVLRVLFHHLDYIIILILSVSLFIYLKFWEHWRPHLAKGSPQTLCGASGGLDCLILLRQPPVV